MDYQLTQPISAEEWRIFHEIRRVELFESRGVAYNENHPDDRAPNHFPLVLKLDDAVIGTARLDLLSNGDAAMRLVAIIKNQQGRGHGHMLEQKFEEFARSKNVKRLLVNARPSAGGYYEKHGFHKENWEDPGTSLASRNRDVQMVKVL